MKLIASIDLADPVLENNGRLTLQAARTYLADQLNAVRKHLEAAKKSGQTESVHQVRVGCRRIRAGLRFFSDCFEPRQLKNWRKATKKILKQFGPARDLDVQIEFLKRFLKETNFPEKRLILGIKRVLLRLEQSRQRLQKKIVKVAECLDKKHFFLQFEMALETLAEQQSGSVLTFERLACSKIESYIKAVLSQLDSLSDPQAIERHHKLRIAIKKLRYAIEICNMAMGDAFKADLKKLKHFQDVLGMMHDCDVWQDMAQSFWRQEHQYAVDYFGHARPLNRLKPGLEYLLENRRQQRQELHQQAVFLAKQLSDEDFWRQITEKLIFKELKP